MSNEAIGPSSANLVDLAKGFERVLLLSGHGVEHDQTTTIVDADEVEGPAVGWQLTGNDGQAVKQQFGRSDEQVLRLARCAPQRRRAGRSPARRDTARRRRR